MSEVAIAVNHLNKIYRLYDKPIDRLKESLGLSRKKDIKSIMPFGMSLLRSIEARRLELLEPMVRENRQY